MQIPVPPDLGEMKDTVMFGLTKKQIIFFVLGAIVGLPVFFLCMKPLGSSNAALLMLLCMFPFFMLGIYQKNGYSADKLLVFRLRHNAAHKVRKYESLSDKEKNEKLKRKEVKKLEKEVGSTFTYKVCKGLYKAGKFFRGIGSKIARGVDKKPY